MTLQRVAVPALFLLAALFGGTAMLPLVAARAQPPPGMVMLARQTGGQIEDRIAFLKAELAITPDQQALWEQVAAAMRADVADFQNLRAQLGGTAPSEPAGLQHRTAWRAFRTLRVIGEQRFRVAFRPLYATLSVAQRQAADQMFRRRHALHAGRKGLGAVGERSCGSWALKECLRS